MNDIDYYRQQLSEFSHLAFRRHLVGGTGGNLSIRIPGTDTVLVTPTGISLEQVEPAENILVNLEGEIIESPQGLKGSKETGFHLAAYKLKPDVGGIAHVHPPYATAYSNKARQLPLATISARVVLKHVPCVECFAPGSAELRNAVIGGLQKNPEVSCILMKEHGILAMGRDLRQAYYFADLTEDTAKIAYVAATIPDDTAFQK
jgi:L-ribulose-5-phosphate 4-epimerase